MYSLAYSLMQKLVLVLTVISAVNCKSIECDIISLSDFIDRISLLQ